jgi:hypothetical protein
LELVRDSRSLKGVAKPQNVNVTSGSGGKIGQRRKLSATILDRVD